LEGSYTYVTEREIPYLKENGLASTGKPSAAERIQQGIPSTDININENKIIINNFIFEFLLEYNALEKLVIETYKKFEKFNKSFEG